jgi:hypothetical protein
MGNPQMTSLQTNLVMPRVSGLSISFRRTLVSSASVGLCAVGLIACGGNKKEVASADAVVEGQRADDQSRCEFKGRDDRDVQESSAPGMIVPNVRRVYGYIGAGSERRRILLCREVDTNFDGVKDLMRTYGDNGEKLTEQADTDYNGKVDTWIAFGKTQPMKIEVDKSGDGKPDEVRFYTEGTLSRIQRDTNGDEKPDIFEVYRDGHLERMGLDTNFDGQVDVWHRDEGRAREDEAEEASAQKNADGAEPAGAGDQG